MSSFPLRESAKCKGMSNMDDIQSFAYPDPKIPTSHFLHYSEVPFHTPQTDDIRLVSEETKLWMNPLNWAFAAAITSQYPTPSFCDVYVDPRTVAKSWDDDVKKTDASRSPLETNRHSFPKSPISDQHVAIDNLSQTIPGFSPIVLSTSPIPIRQVSALSDSPHLPLSPHDKTLISLSSDMTVHNSIASSNSSPQETKELTPPPSPPIRRRGPGRPSKAQQALQGGKRLTGHSAVKLRRQMHNDSAMRSRARLNNMLDELWIAIPKHERVMPQEEEPEEHEVCRAVKVEVAIHYIKKLQSRRDKFDQI